MTLDDLFTHLANQGPLHPNGARERYGSLYMPTPGALVMVHGVPMRHLCTTGDGAFRVTSMTGWATTLTGEELAEEARVFLEAHRAGLSWREVFNAGYVIQDVTTAFLRAEEAGYPYVAWNGRVYETRTGRPCVPEVLEADLR